MIKTNVLVANWSSFNQTEFRSKCLRMKFQKNNFFLLFKCKKINSSSKNVQRSIANKGVVYGQFVYTHFQTHVNVVGQCVGIIH